MHHTPRTIQQHPITLPYRLNYYNHDPMVQLAAHRHAQLLRQQAEIQRFVRTNAPNIDTAISNRPSAAAYQREVKQKQQRIISMLNQDTSFQLQHLKLREALFEQQLSYQNMLQKMELNHYYLLHSRPKTITNSHKHPQYTLASIGNILTSRDQSKIVDRYRSIDGSKLSEIFYCINLKEDKMQKNNQQKLLREHERNGYSNHSAGRENKKVGRKEWSSCRQSRADEKKGQSLHPLNNKRSHSVGEHKTKNRVSFNISNNIVTTHPPNQAKSHSLQPKEHKPSLHNKQSNQHCIQEEGRRKIQARITLSQFIYRDSQLKNIKYEHIHLLNTYHNELKLRHSLKTRINSYPKITDKYSIVVQPQQ